MERSGVQLKMPTSRRLKTGGALDTMHITVGSYLTFSFLYHGDNWDDLLQDAELSYNSSVTEYLGVSIFEQDRWWSSKFLLNFTIHN